ncbi:MAG: hypothetical protein HKL91_08445 [Candidatus Eremiobacteraeota bacterium]|uniref:Uncharacterized protein n=1 Tax=mine drainage metagenome TaxID=410659 RepID=E6PCT3_9ZZZZ|nr:hypothetical protein [Candidatus Eremiobacteraeota bacterium]
MTTLQQQAVAAGFLHVLGASPNLYSELEKISKHDTAAVGAFIAKTLGLAQPPNASDLAAMAAYADDALHDQAEKIKESGLAAPTTVGMMFFMQPG